ncbi:hypothetical protein BJY00DRAFT_316152 [Aspergillus carlsbadensis]|nr:hypothetical protein BJY00DRAFT_316152 [Aspergillus carlsbadensis]
MPITHSSRYPRRFTPKVRGDVATAALSGFESATRVDFGKFSSKIGTLWERLKRLVTYAEKVLYSHLDDEFDNTSPVARRSYSLGPTRPRRLSRRNCPDGAYTIHVCRPSTSAVPTAIHCDHLIVGRDGEEADLPRALETYQELYDFMEGACQKYKVGVWRPGAGIIHQIVLESYAYSAGMMVGTDSHTPNAGGMGTIAIGAGGANAVDVMAGLPLELTAPRILGVRLHGALSGRASPKDIINKLAGMISSSSLQPAMPFPVEVIRILTKHIFPLQQRDDSHRSKLDVSISPQSQRLQKPVPFAPWDSHNLTSGLIPIKTKGNCTTDHITPAGPWFLNAETGNANQVRSQLSEQDGDVRGTARYYQSQGQPWVVVADHNYSEGSSRKHAALQPRYLGGVAIVAKSFARIHEANFKGQGMLAVTLQRKQIMIGLGFRIE